LKNELKGNFFTAEQTFGMSEVSLFCALDWFLFRKTYAVEKHPRLMAFLAAHKERPALLATAPR